MNVNKFEKWIVECRFWWINK